MKEAPESLNRIVDVVLAYRPKPKTKQVKKRSRRAKRQHSETHSQPLETS